MRASRAWKRWRQRPRRAQAQDRFAPLGAANGADDEQSGAQRHQPRRVVLGHLALEVGDQIELGNTATVWRSNLKKSGPAHLRRQPDADR